MERSNEESPTIPCPSCGSNVKACYPNYEVEFSVHLRYSGGETTYRREDIVPFVPVAGLVVLDDVLGEFTLRSVAWHGPSRLFLCQGNVRRDEWSLRKANGAMRRAGWTEDRESRMPN